MFFVCLLCLLFKAIHGQAIDRHLLGLKIQGIEDLTSMPEIFMDTSYAVANHFNLSTSQVYLRLTELPVSYYWVNNCFPLHVFTRVVLLSHVHVQVGSKTDCVMCFGPMVPDGYGVCYNPMDEHINIAITAFNSCEETNAANFAQAVEEALLDMRALLEDAATVRQWSHTGAWHAGYICELKLNQAVARAVGRMPHWHYRTKRKPAT